MNSLNFEKNQALIPQIYLRHRRKVEAKKILIEKINYYRSLFVETLLIITGKGNQSYNQTSVLKPLTYNLLRQFKNKGIVSSFETAPEELGGSGALLVKLNLSNPSSSKK